MLKIYINKNKESIFAILVDYLCLVVLESTKEESLVEEILRRVK